MTPGDKRHGLVKGGQDCAVERELARRQKGLRLTADSWGK